MKICTAFVGKPQWEGGWPYIGFDNEKLKEHFLDKLKKRFPQIEFASGEVIGKYEREKLVKLKELAGESDGLLIFTIGFSGDMGPVDAAVELIELNVPTILANYMYAGDHYFVIIWSRIRGRGFKVLPVSSPDFGDVEKAVETMHNLHSVKGKKILLYVLDEPKMSLEGASELVKSMSMEQVEKIFGSMEKMMDWFAPGQHYLDFAGVDQAHQWRRDEQKYRRNLAEVFGIEMIKRYPEELLDAYRGANKDEARKIADKWISGARKVEVSQDAVLNAANLYVALKDLMRKYNTDVINVDCGTLVLSGWLPAMLCMSIYEFQCEGLTAGPESDMDSTVSLLLARYLTGRPGFTSNQSIDLRNNRVTYAHCCPPNKLYGPGGPTQPYDLRGHGESHALVGPVPWVDYPVGEPLTTIKVSMLEKKIAISTGKIVDLVRDEKGCEMKVAVETNARRIFENFDHKTFGWHRVSFVGDFREEVITAAKLLGLEVVEEDK